MRFWRVPVRWVCGGGMFALSFAEPVQVMPVLSPPAWGWGNVCLSLEVVMGEQDAEGFSL